MNNKYKKINLMELLYIDILNKNNKIVDILLLWNKKDNILKEIYRRWLLKVSINLWLIYNKIRLQFQI